MSDAEMMEVRCCCDAKLLGFLPAPKPGSTNVTFPLYDTYSGNPDEPNFSSVTLEVGIAARPSGDKYRAYKSMHLPMETLERISCFVKKSA